MRHQNCNSLLRFTVTVSPVFFSQTLATCQMFNAEVCYGSGLQYNTDSCGGDVKREIEDFLLDNALPSYFLGVCQDFKHLADELCMFDNVSESITRF